MLGRKDLIWKGLDLYVGTKKSGFSIVQDEKYPNMWRIKTAVNLSDMLNKSRAKDLAESVLMTQLNREEEDVKETSSGK